MRVCWGTCSFRHVFKANKKKHSLQSHLGSTTSDHHSPNSSMPRSSSAKPKADRKVACDIENIYREWKAAPACRHVAVETDRIFQSHQGRGKAIKFCIKDAVHNKFVLTPLLERLTLTPQLKLPSVKALAREILVLHWKNVANMNAFMIGQTCQFNPNSLREGWGIPGFLPGVGSCYSILRIKLFRIKMNLVPQKDKVKLDAWCCKSMLSFIKGKTNKNLGSVAPQLQPTPTIPNHPQPITYNISCNCFYVILSNILCLSVFNFGLHRYIHPHMLIPLFFDSSSPLCSGPCIFEASAHFGPGDPGWSWETLNMGLLFGVNAVWICFLWRRGSIYYNIHLYWVCVDVCFLKGI